MGEKILEEGLTVILGRKKMTTISITHMTDLVADNADIIYEPPAGSENSHDNDIEADTAKPVLSTSTAPPPFVRR